TVRTDRLNSKPGSTAMAMPLARTDFHSALSGQDTNGPGALALIRPETKAGVRILLADEESAQREGCASLLREEGYDLVTCGHAHEALQLVQRRPFDIVLVDCGMREADGLMLLQTARAANPDAQGIVMTRHPSVEGCVEA